MDFDQWMVLIAYRMGVCVEELEPENWRGLFDSGLTPDEATNDALGISMSADTRREG